MTILSEIKTIYERIHRNPLSFPTVTHGNGEGNSPLLGILVSFPKLQPNVGILNGGNLRFQEQSKEQTKRNLKVEWLRDWLPFWLWWRQELFYLFCNRRWETGSAIDFGTAYGWPCLFSQFYDLSLFWWSMLIPTLADVTCRSHISTAS